MYHTIQKYIQFIIAVVFSLTIISCENNNNKQESLTSVLEKSFGDIYLARYGLEYPSTEEHLNNCIQNSYKPCLDVYNRVIKGKKTIISLPADKALDATLDIIEQACILKDDNSANITCHGGIMSLYFYNSHEQDTKILSRVKKYPKEIQSLIFGNYFYWFHNRPDHIAWINYIVAEIDLDYEKRIITDKFRISIDELDDKPWVLR